MDSKALENPFFPLLPRGFVAAVSFIAVKAGDHCRSRHPFFEDPLICRFEFNA